MDVFCKIINGELPANICFENDDVISIMDANPFSPGHVLVIPKHHYTTVLDMDKTIIGEIHEVAIMLMKKMEEKYLNIKGIRMVVNYGEPQAVKHYHLHLVPVYDGKAPQISQEEFCKMLKESN